MAMTGVERMRAHRVVGAVPRSSRSSIQRQAPGELLTREHVNLFARRMFGSIPISMFGGFFTRPRHRSLNLGKAHLTRTAGPLFACALALISAQASAQAGATTPALGHPEVDQKAVPSEPQRPTANPPTADDVCRTLEEAAAENGLPVEFFARVIWQESRFNAQAVSPKGASGIAQFMPQTAGWHGLADPFDPIEALRHSAAYLRELRERFGNLGLAAAA